MSDDYAPNLLWVDMETTGLDPGHDLLLEIAVVVTTSDLDEVFAESKVVHQDIHLNELSTWVLEQHTVSGLFLDVVKMGESMNDVTRWFRDILTSSALFPDYPVDDARPPLCGSSINFERQWLQTWFPQVYQHIHYRSIDVSSIKELMKRWLPDEAISRRETSKHRAMNDIFDSIDELRHYRDVLNWGYSAPRVFSELVS